MSMRGIDGQMIINRTGDYARDVSAQLRRDANVQDYLAHQNKVASELEKEQVTELEAKENPRTRLDERKGSGGSGQGEASGKKKGTGKEEKQEFQGDNPSIGVMPPKLLDIEI